MGARATPSRTTAAKQRRGLATAARAPGSAGQLRAPVRGGPRRAHTAPVEGVVTRRKALGRKFTLRSAGLPGSESRGANVPRKQMRGASGTVGRHVPAPQLAAVPVVSHTATYVPAKVDQRLRPQTGAIAREWKELARARQDSLEQRVRAQAQRACVDGVLGGLVLSTLRPAGQLWRTARGVVRVHPLRARLEYGDILPKHVVEAYVGVRTAGATCKPCLACMAAESAMCLHPPGAGEMWRRGDLLEEKHVAAAGDRDFEPSPPDSGKSDWEVLGDALERKIVTRENARLVLDHTMAVLRGVFGDEACEDYARHAPPMYVGVCKLLERPADEWTKSKP
ncbi:unnamed protein product [Pedinophyceae sp. YPF-701]|nr:unnamed protein product [Pedinophyceae sp. YPF-701]